MRRPRGGGALTNSGADERRRVTDVLEALALDEITHAIREVLIVGFHIVFQNQPAQGPCRFILVGGEKTKNKKQADASYASEDYPCAGCEYKYHRAL